MNTNNTNIWHIQKGPLVEGDYSLTHKEALCGYFEEDALISLLGVGSEPIYDPSIIPHLLIQPLKDLCPKCKDHPDYPLIMLSIS